MRVWRLADYQVYYHVRAKKEIKRNHDKKRDRDTEVVIVSKREGKTYADLLRTVKEGIKEAGDEVTRNIHNIRQTRDGDMLITLKAGQHRVGLDQR